MSVEKGGVHFCRANSSLVTGRVSLAVDGPRMQHSAGHVSNAACRTLISGRDATEPQPGCVRLVVTGIKGNRKPVYKRNFSDLQDLIWGLV